MGEGDQVLAKTNFEENYSKCQRQIQVLKKVKVFFSESGEESGETRAIAGDIFKAGLPADKSSQSIRKSIVENASIDLNSEITVKCFKELSAIFDDAENYEKIINLYKKDTSKKENASGDSELNKDEDEDTTVKKDFDDEDLDEDDDELLDNEDEENESEDFRFDKKDDSPKEDSNSDSENSVSAFKVEYSDIADRFFSKICKAKSPEEGKKLFAKISEIFDKLSERMPDSFEDDENIKLQQLVAPSVGEWMRMNDIPEKEFFELFAKDELVESGSVDKKERKVSENLDKVFKSRTRYIKLNSTVGSYRKMAESALNSKSKVDMNSKEKLEEFTEDIFLPFEFVNENYNSARDFYDMVLTEMAPMFSKMGSFFGKGKSLFSSMGTAIKREAKMAKSVDQQSKMNSDGTMPSDEETEDMPANINDVNVFEFVDAYNEALEIFISKASHLNDPVANAALKILPSLLIGFDIGSFPKPKVHSDIEDDTKPNDSEKPPPGEEKKFGGNTITINRNINNYMFNNMEQNGFVPYWQGGYGRSSAIPMPGPAGPVSKESRDNSYQYNLYQQLNMNGGGGFAGPQSRIVGFDPSFIAMMLLSPYFMQFLLGGFFAGAGIYQRMEGEEAPKPNENQAAEPKISLENAGLKPSDEAKVAEVISKVAEPQKTEEIKKEVKDEVNKDPEIKNLNPPENKLDEKSSSSITKIKPNGQSLINRWVRGLRPVVRVLALIASRGDIADLKSGQMKDNSISKFVKNEISQLIKDGDELMHMLESGSEPIVAMSRYNTIEGNLSDFIDKVKLLISQNKKTYDEHYNQLKDLSDLIAIKNILKGLPEQKYTFKDSQKNSVKEMLEFYAHEYADRQNNPKLDDIYENEPISFKHFFSNN